MTVQVLDKYAKAREDVLKAVREIRRNKLSNPNITEKLERRTKNEVGCRN